MMIVGSQLVRVVQKFPTNVVIQVVKSSGILKAQDISTSYENIKLLCMEIFPSSELIKLNFTLHNPYCEKYQGKP